MPTPTIYPARPRRGPLCSPLAAAPHSPSAASRSVASSGRTAAFAAVPDPRSVTLDEFDEYLRAVNDRDGRPYEQATINAYVYPPRHHPHPAQRGHPPAGTARHGHAHPPRRPAQEPRLPPRPAQRRPERRGTTAGQPLPGHLPGAGRNLRVRRSHKLADSEWVWLGTRNRGRLGNTARNNAWLKNRTPTLNLRNLISRGLTRDIGAWALALPSRPADPRPACGHPSKPAKLASAGRVTTLPARKGLAYCRTDGLVGALPAPNHPF